MTRKFDSDASLELQVLQILDIHRSGLNVHQILDALLYFEQPARSRNEINNVLESLRSQGWAARDGERFTQFGFWIITDQGDRSLRDHEAHTQSNEATPQLLETIWEAKQPPAIATLCISEPELDAWWGEFDVEIKAAVFSMFVLGSERPQGRAIEEERRERPFVYPDAAGEAVQA